MNICDSSQLDSSARPLAGRYMTKTRDPLTGLPGQNLLAELLAVAIRSARHRDRRLALLAIEFKGFAKVDAGLGRNSGDEFLRQASIRLQACLGESDVLAHLGVGRFMVVVQDLERIGEAGHHAQKLRGRLGSSFDLSGLLVDSLPAIGLAIFPGDGECAEALMHNACQAMYQARDMEGEMLNHFDSAIQDDFLARRSLELDLESALERKEFVVLYQPVLQLRDRSLSGVEALIRWNHPEHGLIGPEVFLSTAAENGMINAIGCWVIEEACRQIGEWQSQGLKIPVSVNIADRQVPDGIQAEWLQGILERNKLRPGDLAFEFTERTLRRQSVELRRWFEEMKRLQVKLVLDEFGGVDSTVACFSNTDVSHIKIDRSIVSSIHHDTRSHALIKSITTIGKNMGIQVTAKGVEDPDTLRVLEPLGCNHIQGMQIGCPELPDRIPVIASRQGTSCRKDLRQRSSNYENVLAFV